MRKFAINVNGKSYEVEVQEIGEGVAAPRPVINTATPAPTPADAAPQPAPEKPASPQSSPSGSVPQGAETVKAPMPGVILDVKVQSGDTVSKGQVLAILEAMKMENEIMCPRDGQVASIQVAKGASVNAGDVLIAIQ